MGRTANITISVGVIEDSWDAGVITTGIGDYVWDDTNQDGIQDTGETGVPGVTVNLRSQANGTIVQTTTTDAYGVYFFAGVTPPGNYRAEFTNLPGGYVFSPANLGGNDALDSDVNNGQIYTNYYTLTLNNFNPSVDAGMYQLTSPEMDVQGLGNSITDGDVTPDVTDDTDFGSILVSSGTVVHTFTIFNIGAANLTLNGTPTVAISGTHASDFTVNVQPAGTVTPASSTTFQVTFDPSAGGTRQASISIINNDPDEDPYNFDIQGTGLAPEMDVQGNSVSIADGDNTPDVLDHSDFGNTDLAIGSVIRTYTIENTGGSDLDLTDNPIVQISGAHAGDFTVNVQPASSTVTSGGGTVTFQVTFDPSATGLRSAAISIANTDLDENPYNFSIQGTGTAAAEMDVQGLGNSIVDGDATPGVSDDTEFGSQDILTGTAVHTFTIYNTGSDDLNLTGIPIIEIGGANAGDYLVSQQPASSTVSSGGGSVTFEVTFNPTLEGLRQATISISNDDSDENPYTFAIQGTGTAVPEMDVQGNKISITSGDVTPDASDFTDFGNTELSGPAITRIFKIHSIGSDTLNLTDASPYVTIGGTHAADFSVTITPSNMIEYGDSTTFQITFDPSATGVRSATISIANDDTDENPYTFAIQGTGDPDPAPLLVLVKGVDKANAAPGDTLTYTVDYSNAGDADATTIIILDQVPPNTTYVENSATGSGTTILFSHDGGGSYNASQTAPVTHLQFQRGALLAPGGSGSISFEVTIN